MDFFVLAVVKVQGRKDTKVQTCTVTASLHREGKLSSGREVSVYWSSCADQKAGVASRPPRLLGPVVCVPLKVKLHKGKSHSTVPDQKCQCHLGKAVKMPFKCLHRAFYKHTISASCALYCDTCLLQYSVLEPCLLTDVIEFHCMVSLHLSATVTAPVAIRTGCYSHWQLRNRNVLTILVGQLSEATQATAVTQHSISSDSVIRQYKYTSL